MRFICCGLLYLVTMVFTCGSSLAEQVPCRTGQSTCTGAESLSVINTTPYCCDPGFNMQWKNELVNGTSKTDCICDRYYYETACIEDRIQCQGATSLASDGASVRCCKNGDSMNSASTIVNGVRSSYCKCIRYNKPGGMVMNRTPVLSEEQQMLQQLQYWGSLGLLPEEMQAQMSQMQRALNPNAGSGGIGQWAMSFFEGLARGLQQALDPASRTNTTEPRGPNRNRRPINRGAVLNTNVNNNADLPFQPMIAVQQNRMQRRRQQQQNWGGGSFGQSSMTSFNQIPMAPGGQVNTNQSPSGGNAGPTEVNRYNTGPTEVNRYNTINNRVK
ncbi:unnamed protein product [Lymnaea stagnalis]|uniref:Uncharacterized protein n=1 Tax=Lymnaea stagnalis TaxID=6523 RepID=A0AAV2HWQ7_LYMST